MNDIGEQLANLRQLIDAACRRAGRPRNGVRLLAVSKTFDAAALAGACAAGQCEFAESYVQEALPKMESLAALGLLPIWHFIGPLQSNKTRHVADHFSWVHTVDRLKIADRLSAQRPVTSPPLEVCIQINISAEAGKSGCAAEAAASLCAATARLPQLRLRGLMTIPRLENSAEASRPAFRALRALFERIRAGGDVDPAHFDTLSMGMSGDFEVAVEEGATLVRVGTALFGTRGG